MDQNEFEQLRYGNIIRDKRSGRLFAVTILSRKDGKAQYIGMTRAIDAQDATTFDLVSKNRNVSHIGDKPIASETIPEE